MPGRREEEATFPLAKPVGPSGADGTRQAGRDDPSCRLAASPTTGRAHGAAAAPGPPDAVRAPFTR